MGVVAVEVSLLVGAAPEKVYMVLADPRHHKNILPSVFVDYKSNADGLVTFSVKKGILKRDYEVRPEETEPPNLFRETDVKTGITTEFRLNPHEQGTLVTISTRYETPSTIVGFIESLFAPSFLKDLYHEELVKLGRYVLLV